MSENTTNINNAIDEMDAVFAEYPHENRADHIKIIAEKLSPFHAWLRLFADYNYQVENGGHMQYLSNGYHSSTQRGCVEDISTNANLLGLLIQYSARYVDELPTMSSIIDIMKKIDIDIETDEYEECHNCYQGTVTEYNEDLDEDEDIECPECYGEGQIRNENYNSLTKAAEHRLEEIDDEFYKINETFLDEIESKALDLIEKKI